MPLRPTERALLKGAMFGYDTYEVYAADSDAEARQFLNGISITEQQFYVVVEVPGGVIARDRGGIYSPSASWRGDGWTSIKWEEADSKARKQFWQHWTGPTDGPSAESGAAQKKGCFIATACYGDYDAPEVRILRHFRDNTLLNSKHGHRVVDLYYRTSPPLAQWLERHPIIAGVIRAMVLNPITTLVGRMHK
jgi:hypothetical protein